MSYFPVQQATVHVHVLPGEKDKDVMFGSAITTDSEGIKLKFANKRDISLNGTFSWTTTLFLKDGSKLEKQSEGTLSYGGFYIENKMQPTWGPTFVQDQLQFAVITATFVRTTPTKETEVPEVELKPLEVTTKDTFTVKIVKHKTGIHHVPKGDLIRFAAYNTTVRVQAIRNGWFRIADSEWIASSNTDHMLGYPRFQKTKVYPDALAYRSNRVLRYAEIKFVYVRKTDNRNGRHLCYKVSLAPNEKPIGWVKAKKMRTYYE